MVSFLVGIILTGLVQLAFRPGAASGSNGSQEEELAGPLVSESRGAWGRLLITPMILDRPEELFDSQAVPAPPLRWSFPNHTAEQLAAFLASCDLTEAQRTTLLDTNRWQPGPTGWYLWPPLDVARDLSEPAREKIYAALAQSPDNSQRYPFLCREDQFEEMFEGCELSSERVSLVRRLCFHRRGLLHFADSQLFELLSSPNEARCLFKTLLRVPTMMVKLHVTRDADLDALARYWDAGGRAKDLRPLLQSLARVPDGGTINVSFFLPPLPRMLLYTYPQPTNGPHRDCFWTAFNFFGERPGYRLGDVAFADALLHADYVRVQGEKRFGDLLLLTENGYAMHACVYLAGDIYYTKNGTDPNQPWVLMTMKDMMTQYTSGQPQEWRVYRRKPK